MPAGPTLHGHWQGQVLGSGSDNWKYWDELKAGKITHDDWTEIKAGIARSYGHCMTLPSASSIPAPDANHPRMATQSGRRIVEMVWEDLSIERVQSKGVHLKTPSPR